MSNSGSFELSTTIEATGMQALLAFVDAAAIKTWWKAKNAVLQPRPGGLFAVEWEPGSPGHDEKLGPLGGVLAGVLDKAMAGHFVHFGSLHWLTPQGEVFGPTRLEVDVFSKGDPRRKPSELRIRGTGFQTGEAWNRYFERSRAQWEKLLPEVARYCETLPAGQAESSVTPLGGPYLAQAVLDGRRIS